MDRFLPGIVVGTLVLTSVGFAQVTPAQTVVSSPITVVTDENVRTSEDAADIALDPASLLPDLPALPPEKATLVGGAIEKIDRVQDVVTIRVFGGGRTKILFDTRTRVYRDGEPALASDLRPGDRVYVDTILSGDNIFARNIRLRNGAALGESMGVVKSYRPDKGELLVRDQISPEILKVRVSSSTKIVQGDRAVSAGQLVPGSLVALKFGAEGGRDWAREVTLLAVPGASFTFAGQVVTLNLRTGLLVLTSATDHKTYEVYLDPSIVHVDDNVRQGADVTVLARFEGDRYTARRVTLNPHAEK